jgi:gamma-glutamyltranspeptidase / glutathione hydrolase
MKITRDFVQPGRSAAIGDAGMAATSHPAATLAAVDLLRRGGNAVDAALAAVAVQCVVDPLMTGIGGDCFAMISEGGALPTALNGSGRAPQAATVSAYAALGISEIRDFTAHAVTVPGAVDAWCRLSADHGRLPLVEVLEPAIRYAEDGFRVTPRVAHDWDRFKDRIGRDPAARAQFLADGAAPIAGARLANPALGRTLAAIAADGRDAFYEGPVAEEIVSLLKDRGGLHSLSDFAGQHSVAVEPIAASYRGYTLHECPPNGQGLAALIILRILEGFPMDDPSLPAADRVHLFAEATRIAYGLRDAFVGDPRSMTIEPEALLAEPFVESLRRTISPSGVGRTEALPEVAHKDTVYVTVVDADGNAVSLINSLFHAFGSGIYAPRSGVLLQNRGLAFGLTEGHPNAIAPGRRPMHTIIPGMLSREGRVVLSFGVMGGQYQAAGHAQFVSSIVDRGFDLQRACDVPRSFAFEGRLTLESAHDPGIVADLSARGHRVDWTDDPLGGCQAIWIDPATGALFGASDHRKDGMALGI